MQTSNKDISTSAEYTINHAENKQCIRVVQTLNSISVGSDIFNGGGRCMKYR